MSEDALVAAIAEIVAPTLVHSRVLLGIGDDAAVWQPSRSNRSVISTDALVDGVHFNTDWMSLREVGVRAMEANLSDMAAMGARPVLATVALGFPHGVEGGDVLELYRGIAASALRAHCAVAGGDTTRAAALTLAITIIGEVRPSNLTLRSGAKAGDAIVCTGRLGSSRAGLAHLRGDVVLAGEQRDWAVRAYVAPQARLAEGKWLAASSRVHAMMDISDGLSTDLARICSRSKVGALIEDLPVCHAAMDAAAVLGETPEAFALAGGEEYELLAAVESHSYPHLAARFRARFGRELYRIGTFRAVPGIALRDSGGHERPVVATGWDSLESHD